MLPDEFEFFNPQVELWVPLSLGPREPSRDRRDTLVVGRLADGVSMETARAELEEIHARLAPSLTARANPTNPSALRAPTQCD